MTSYRLLYREEGSLKYSFQSNFVLLLQECHLIFVLLLQECHLIFVLLLQECHLVFGSWTHNKNEIDLQFEENTTGIDLEMFYGPYRVRIAFLPIGGPITCKQR